MKTLLRPAISLFIMLSIISGLIYPFVTAGFGKVLFSDKTDGSMIEQDHKLVGSALIGQNFSSANYFWSRPSATSPMPFNGLGSTGSNFSPTNPAQKSAVTDRVKALQDADPSNKEAIPIDLVTASGSGLDPEISPAAAYYQAGRVAKARNLNPETVRQLIAQNTEGAQWGLFGEPRVNVLRLNLALDQAK